jgi:hypothetical protein
VVLAVAEVVTVEAEVVDSEVVTVTAEAVAEALEVVVTVMVEAVEVVLEEAVEEVVQCVEAVEAVVETDTVLTKPIIISFEKRRPLKQTNKPIVLDCPQDQISQEFKSRKPKPLLLKTNFKLPHPIQQCCHALSSSCPTQFNNIATPSLQVAPFNSTMLPRPVFKLPHSIQQCWHALSSRRPSLISTMLPRPHLHGKANSTLSSSDHLILMKFHSEKPLQLLQFNNLDISTSCHALLS